MQGNGLFDATVLGGCGGFDCRYEPLDAHVFEHLFEHMTGMFGQIFVAGGFAGFVVDHTDTHEGFFFVVAADKDLDGDFVTITTQLGKREVDGIGDGSCAYFDRGLLL